MPIELSPNELKVSSLSSKAINSYIPFLEFPPILWFFICLFYLWFIPF
jgi:hypothetical protein